MMDNTERAVVELIKESKGKLSLTIVRREDILAGAWPGEPAIWDAWLGEWANDPSECMACDARPENPAAFAVAMPRYGENRSIVTAICPQCARRSDASLMQEYVAMVQQAIVHVRRCK